jgi:hypothetical protein
MNRLTARSKNGEAYYPVCIEACDGEPQDCGNCDIDKDICDRLAAYEDTGLTPERIRELQNAFNILFESERQKQQENERLNAALDKAVDMIGDNSRCPTDYRLRKCSEYETCLHCWKDWFWGWKNDV